MSPKSIDDLTEPSGTDQKSLSAVCPSGPYLVPKEDDIIDPSSPLDIEWDPTCFPNSTSLQVDLYSDDPDQRQLLYGWSVTNSSSGHLTVDLDPSWWNNTNSASVYFDITPSPVENIEDALSLPSGPTFNLASHTTTAPTKVSDSLTSSSSTNWTSDRLNPLHLTKPQYAAAIVAPIVTVVVLGAVVWAIVRSRAKTARERRQWEEGIRPITRY